MRGYQIYLTKEDGTKRMKKIERLDPGEEIFFAIEQIQSIAVYRENGDFVGTYNVRSNFSKQISNWRD